MSNNLFDRQRSALVQLTDAARGRATAEAELTATFTTAAEKAEREVTRARKADAAAREQEFGALESEHKAAVGLIARNADSELFLAERTRDERRKQTTERYNTAAQKGQTEFK